MKKSISWDQIKLILNNISVILNKVVSVVKMPTGANQMLVTGGDGQSKWVKRTHWHEKYKGYLLENYSPKYIEAWGEFDILVPFNLIAGEEYAVIYNGVEYTCVAENYEGQVIMGNPNGDPDGAPFVIGSWETGGFVYPFESSVTSLNLSIYGTMDDLEKIDTKYLDLNLQNGLAYGSLRSIGAYPDVSDENSIDYEYNLGELSIALGESSIASGYAAHASGVATLAMGDASHAEGEYSTAEGLTSHAEGRTTYAIGNYSHAEGSQTWAYGSGSHSEGSLTTAYGEGSHAEGNGGLDQIKLTGEANTKTYTTNYNSSIRVGKMVEYANVFATIVSCTNTSITLDKTLSTRALNNVYCAMFQSVAAGNASHSEGSKTYATGTASHAENTYTMAKGDHSHAEGYDTIAASYAQHVQGKHNIEDAEEHYLHIVGNGQSKDNRSNAHTLDWDGNAWYQGEVYVGGTAQTNGSEKLVKQSELNSALANVPTFSGDYNDLINKPTIPSTDALELAIGAKANTSDLTSHTDNKSNPHEVTLSQLGVTATADELNYVDGVTSNVQTQLNGKVSTSRKVNNKALSADITLSASDVGAAPATHDQAASTITSGTFAGAVSAHASTQTTSTMLLRNSKLVTTETNPSNNGEICWMYE